MLRKMLFIAVFMKNINLFQAIFEQKYLHDLKLFEVSSKSESIKLSGNKMKDTYSMFNLKKCYLVSKPDTVQTLHLKINLYARYWVRHAKLVHRQVLMRWYVPHFAKTLLTGNGLRGPVTRLDAEVAMASSSSICWFWRRTAAAARPPRPVPSPPRGIDEAGSILLWGSCQLCSG